jgi:hypothetical protein
MVTGFLVLATDLLVGYQFRPPYIASRADVQTTLRLLPRCGCQGLRTCGLPAYDASSGLDHTR